MTQPSLSLNIDTAPALTLRRAILLYRTDNDDQSLATLHDCVAMNGKPVILAGRAMSAAQSRAVAKSLRRPAMGNGFLPPNVLMCDGEHLVWHEPPQLRHLAFKASAQFPDRSIGERAGRVPTPGTIFMASRRSWSVFAYRGNERPTPATPLYQAPYFNVYRNGSICAGNVPVPRATTTERISAWNDAFFRSYFAHANDTGLVDYSGDATGLWRDLLDGKHGEDFPEAALKPQGMTLRQLLQNLGDTV